MIRTSVTVAAASTVAFCLGWGAHAFTQGGEIVATAPGSLRPAPTVAAPSSASTRAPAAPSASVSTEQAFTDIYKNARWGTNGGDAGVSGFGSTARASHVYHAFLQQFMKDLGIHSVVDAGCGDWESTQTVDWTGIDYKGYDIVDSVIEKDRSRFAKPNIQFFQGNIVDAELPEADLLICKQVLQHLPNGDIEKFLGKLGRYKHVLLTDAVNPSTLSAKNRDIEPGQFRELDLTRAPFNVAATKVLTYWDGGAMEQVLYIRR